ncbi:hypothetical protein [Bradyrhizobium sp. USDA 3256]
MGQIRCRVVQTETLEERLLKRARQLRDQASALAPGIEKEGLLKLARQAEAGDTVVSPKSKLTKPIRKPKATWLEPKFYADVEYRDITSEGLLCAISFKGLSTR